MNEKLLKYGSNKDLKLHLELVSFYENIFSNNSIFRACVIVGSFAKGHPDRISDIDLIIFVDDGDGSKAFNLIKNEEPFKVVNKYQDKHGDNFYYKKTIFENFVSAEIHVSEKSSPFKLKKPYITLFDYDNFLTSITENGEAPKHEDFPALTSGGKDMTWALLDLLKWSNRGRTDLVKMHILKIADKFNEHRLDSK